MERELRFEGPEMGGSFLLMRDRMAGVYVCVCARESACW